MPKGKNQKLKLHYLTKILLEKTDETHSLTMGQLQEELAKYEIDAEAHGLRDDIKDLTDKLGIDIIKEKKGRNCFYHVGKREIELAELKLLVDAVQSSKFITEKKSRELIAKLEKQASVYEAKQLERQVYVSGRIKAMNESIHRLTLACSRVKKRM